MSTLNPMAVARDFLKDYCEWEELRHNPRTGHWTNGAAVIPRDTVRAAVYRYLAERDLNPNSHKVNELLGALKAWTNIELDVR